VPPRAQSVVAGGATLTSEGPLGLQQCIDYALERNFSMRQTMAMARAARARVDKERAEFDPQFFGSARSGREAGGSFESPLASGGVTKRFVTGTEIDFEAGQVPTRTGDFRDDYIDSSTSDYALSVRQPLLKGAGLRANRSAIRISELLSQQASATVTAELLETLRAAETAYYAAAVAAGVEKGQRESLDRAQQLVDDVKARHDAGAASQIDVLEAEVALAGARERLVLAQKASKDRIGELWLVLGASLEERLPSVSFAELSDDALPAENPEPGPAFERAMTTAPSAILIVNEVQRKQIELLRARNLALPRLDLELGLASAVLETPVDGASGTTAGSTKVTTSSDWEGVALLRMNIPWTFRAERAQLTAAKAELERSVAAQEMATQRLKQRIFELCRGVEAGRAQVTAASQNARANRQKWDEQMRRHKEGLVSIRDLRESEEELQAAEVREQQARLGLFAGWSALTQLDGTIVNHHGLSL
jgi:outer membrane protein TolC